MMDKKIKNKNNTVGRFNTVDIILVLLLIAAILLFLFVFKPFSWMSGSTSEQVTIRYAVEIKSVNDELKDNISGGNIVFDSATDYNMGNVVSVESSRSYTWEHKAGDEYVHKEDIVGKSDLVVVIKADAIYQKDIGYIVDGKVVAVGTKLDLRFPNYVGSGYCIEITTVA